MKFKVGDFKTTTAFRDAINDVLGSNHITEGRYVKLFEREVEKILHVRHAIAICNGTISLQIIAYYLKTQKIKKDKPVVCVPATTFPATLNAFLMIGYEPILCDINENDLCINIDNLTEDEKKRIDVIVPVSILGYTPDMDKIMLEAKKYGWFVVEDFAEAFGSKYDGKYLGSIGDFGSSSFFVSHVIQAGEMGVITTNDDNYAEAIRKMKNHGRDGDPMKFEHGLVGTNGKTTEFCAAIAFEQLKDFERIVKNRQEIAKTYYLGIKNTNLIAMPWGVNYSMLGYPIIAKSKQQKEFAIKKLHDGDVETRGMFPCLANQKAYQELDENGKVKKYLLGEPSKYPISVKMEENGFYIGVHQYITPIAAEKIAQILNVSK